MKATFQIVARLSVALCVVLTSGLAQVASHAPTLGSTSGKTVVATASAPAPSGSAASMQVTDKAVARVNDTVLTDRDLLREMLAMFPYARQHNGFPKSQEAEIRKGALQMIEFEELVYQEAERRKLTVPAARLSRAEADFRKQFSSQNDFEQYLKTECKGSRQLLRQKIRRSLLIEKLLKLEVADKSKLSPAEVRDFYDKNPQRFQNSESFSIQTISMFCPPNADAGKKQEVRKRAEDALRQAKASKSYEEFGLLAEKISEDDYKVNMGLHKVVGRNELPPDVVKAALAMTPGQVSDLIQVDNAYTLFRLIAHAPAAKIKFEQVQDKLRKDLEKGKYERLRAGLGTQLRKTAKVEEL
jgi:parvulin-like peptidyl-prolyl isomerase